MNLFVNNWCCLPLPAAWPDTRTRPSCCVRAEAESALISSDLDLESHHRVLVVMAGQTTRVIHPHTSAGRGGSPNGASLGLREEAPTPFVSSRAEGRA